MPNEFRIIDFFADKFGEQFQRLNSSKVKNKTSKMSEEERKNKEVEEEDEDDSEDDVSNFDRNTIKLVSISFLITSISFLTIHTGLPTV